jgi:serine/threonine protein phosphatase 1
MPIILAHWNIPAVEELKYSVASIMLTWSQEITFGKVVGIREKPEMTDQSEISADDKRLYIIGDIHGRSDLLDRMVNAIYRDIDKHGWRENLTITLGDYVDRGPDSRGVLERLANNPFPGRYIALKGNHEVLFESFLQQGEGADFWRQLGGVETLHSYGVPIKDLRVGKRIEEAASALNAAIPEAHRAVLSSLKDSITIDDLFLCHAGVRPSIPLDRQDVSDLFWIRDEFLNSTQDFGKIVIHGHSPHEWPEVKPNRVNIDTGAFATGRLTCLVIEGGRGRFLFTA